VILEDYLRNLQKTYQEEGKTADAQATEDRIKNLDKAERLTL
jgi:hypothetical protein